MRDDVCLYTASKINDPSPTRGWKTAALTRSPPQITAIEAWTLFGSLFNGPTLRASVGSTKNQGWPFWGRGPITHISIYQFPKGPVNIYYVIAEKRMSKEVDKSRENTHTHTHPTNLSFRKYVKKKIRSLAGPFRRPNVANISPDMWRFRCLGSCFEQFVGRSTPPESVGTCGWTKTQVKKRCLTCFIGSVVLAF